MNQPVAILFKDWVLDIQRLKLIRPKDQDLQIIWDVRKEPNIFGISNPDRFPVWKSNGDEKSGNRIMLGNLKIAPLMENERIVGSVIRFDDPHTQKVLWSYHVKFDGTYLKAVLPIGEDKRLYLAIFSPIATGSDLVCLDVKTGQEIWHADVTQLEIDHEKYRNEVYLRKIADRIVLAGDEYGGYYLQVFDAGSGRKLFDIHKKFFK